MTDPFGRTINYMRISITDRCNLRCRYCMPREGAFPASSKDLLTYEEILLIAEASVRLGIDCFKITGGEPLIRKGCPDFIRRLKQLPGVRQVTLTTNGLLLADCLDELIEAGIDGINISLDTLNEKQFQEITGSRFSPLQVLSALRLCCRQVKTKINAVLLEETASQLIPLASLARELPVDVRFIEQMPIGPGRTFNRPSGLLPALLRLRDKWPELSEISGSASRGNGPARYYTASGFLGAVGLIEAVSHSFCSSCNRIRLTGTGMLKPCLCYGGGIDLAPILRNGRESRESLSDQIERAVGASILSKPAAHCFDQTEAVSEEKNMNQIGG